MPVVSEVGGTAEIALGKSRSEAWRRWRGRSGELGEPLESGIGMRLESLHLLVLHLLILVTTVLLEPHLA